MSIGVGAADAGREYRDEGHGEDHGAQMSLEPAATALGGLFGLGLLERVDDHTGDVVHAAGGQGLADEGVAAVLGVGVGAQDAGDAAVLHHAAEAVRAQQQPVPGAHAQDVDVWLDGGIAAQRAGDDATLRVDAGLFLGDAALVDEVCHQRVVARDALQGALVQQVGARVAHLRDDELVVEDLRSGHGGAHARAPHALGRGADDGDVGRAHGVGQALPVRGAGGLLQQGVDGYLAGDLSRLVAAHAVCYHEQRGRGDEAVLVVLAHAAHVRARRVHLGDLHLICLMLV